MSETSRSGRMDHDETDGTPIDTDNASITKNGVDFIADRIAGSNFLYVDPAGSTFTVMDDLTRLGDGLEATVTFEWFNTWI